MNEADLALLRRFEPAIRYTRGEQFFPMDVVPYVRESSLWVMRPNRAPFCLIPEGHLGLEQLAVSHPDGWGAFYFLKFIEPLNIAQLAAYTVKKGLSDRESHNRFRGGAGRLARVGYLSRFVDALFTLSLLARGRVPGDTAAAAVQAYRRIQDEWPGHRYYGRVVRQSDWIVLQYWFFYPFNNWRSGFSGVNDHEGDWEMICVYLEEPAEGEFNPVWVACSSHDSCGEDLRRRWDDLELQKVGEHPILYAGAGSHAGYFAPGEYLTEVDLPFLAPLRRLFERLPADSRRILGWSEGDPETGSGGLHSMDVLHIPFVDYARGDGLSIGPTQEVPWDAPLLLDPLPDWVENYRGLWGLYANDPIAGENAPAGPIYNRDGTVRQSWYDPLGWCGLDKVAPPYRTAYRIQERQEILNQRQQTLLDQIAVQSCELTGLGVELAAMQGRPYLALQETACRTKLTAETLALDRLRAEFAANQALLEALDRYAIRLQKGPAESPRAHLRRPRTPISEAQFQLGRFAELWAASSTGLIMISFVLLVFFAPHYIFLGLGLLTMVVLLVEAGARQQFTRFVTGVTIALAVIAALVLIYDFFWTLVVLGVLAAGGYLMWENARELLQ